VDFKDIAGKVEVFIAKQAGTIHVKLKEGQSKGVIGFVHSNLTDEEHG
jgi:hypothetical protein